MSVIYSQRGNGSSSGLDGTATPGPDGTLRWIVPLADIGNPASGTLLDKTFADTRGTFTVFGGGLIYTAAADRAPDKGFGAVWSVGGSC